MCRTLPLTVSPSKAISAQPGNSSRQVAETARTLMCSLLRSCVWRSSNTVSPADTRQAAAKGFQPARNS